MSTKATQQETVVAKLIVHWNQICEKIAALADEMPDSKFQYRPTESVRTFEEMLRHIAFWNYYVAEWLRGKRPDEAANELPREKYPTKADVIEAVRRSASEATAALQASSAQLTPGIVEMVVMFIEHNSEHYGQLSVYARMNGITPPASRS